MGRSSRKAAFNKRYTLLLDLNALYRMNGCSIKNINIENLRRKHQVGKSLPKSIIANFAGRVVDDDLVNEYMATEKRYNKELLEKQKQTREDEIRNSDKKPVCYCIPKAAADYVKCLSKYLGKSQNEVIFEMILFYFSNAQLGSPEPPILK